MQFIVPGATQSEENTSLSQSSSRREGIERAGHDDLALKDVKTFSLFTLF